MMLKTALALAALVGTMSFAAPRHADACGMRWEPEPADAMMLAEAAELERAEQVYAALRIYERAMNDHRAVKSVRIEAALSAARLRASTGDVGGSNQAYGRALRLGAEAAMDALGGEGASELAMTYSAIEPAPFALSHD